MIIIIKTTQRERKMNDRDGRGEGTERKRKENWTMFVQRGVAISNGCNLWLISDWKLQLCSSSISNSSPSFICNRVSLNVFLSLVVYHALITFWRWLGSIFPLSSVSSSLLPPLGIGCLRLLNLFQCSLQFITSPCLEQFLLELIARFDLIYSSWVGGCRTIS